MEKKIKKKKIILKKNLKNYLKNINFLKKKQEFNYIINKQ